MGDVKSLNAARADREQDNSLLSPVECLEDAISEIKSGETPCTSLLLLRLDRGPEGDGYKVGWNACNIRGSEMLALLEVAKATILAEMGYIS